jgi:allantoate deiminase
MRISADRLRSRIEKINAMSKDSSEGFTRLAFGKENKRALHEIRGMMESAGFTTEQDAAGNLFGSYLNGCAPHGFVASGSHLDTVKNGGPFDGLLGVAAAIEAVQTIAEEDVSTHRPLQVIVFSDEEGARFGAGMLGSKAIVGTWQGDPSTDFFDGDGVSLADAMRYFGAAPARISDAKASAGKYHAFIELHIEQGVVLESRQKQIGVVSGIKAPYWMTGSFVGEANHAGGTPMALRRDALVAAANFVAETEKIASRIGDMFVATVGSLEVAPGGINTIPEKVSYTMDIRDLDMARRSDGIAQIKDAAEQCAKRFDVIHESRCIKNESCAHMNPRIMAEIENACRKKSLSYEIMPSGAFHDSLAMSSLCDTGMIFVPSIGGISHSPQENTSWEDIYAGAEILYLTLKSLYN